ncbi:MAG: prepilin peptidase [Candidatus Peribacteraceae bacterium]|jgi:leader peptidase (prepilin peptidase)/N-methyltransferase
MLSPQVFPLATSVLYFILGLAFGSFGTVLVTRIPEGRSIMGRSHCVRCGKTLGALELIPLLSFAFLRGQCGSCAARIPWLYPLIEFFSGLLFVLALFLEGFAFLPATLLALTLWSFFLVTVMDAQTGYVSDYLSFPFLALGVAYAFFSPPLQLAAPLIGAGVFAVQWGVSRGFWVGSGDIIVGAAMGFLLRDWRLLVVALFLSYIIGTLVAVTLMLLKIKSLKDRMVFVPFLFVGTLLTMLFGYTILDWYAL